MAYTSLIIDRLKRLEDHPDLAEVGITMVSSRANAALSQTEVFITCAKGSVILTIDDAAPREHDNIPATVMGVPQTAPNPARKNKTPFIKWLSRHPQLVDAPIDPTALARDAWVEKHGTVPQCYLCGHPMRWVIPRSGGDGFWGCAQFRETDCKGSLNVDEDQMVQPRCPDCGKPMRERDGSKGRFWGCTGYRDGCRRTMDGPVGDGLRTEVSDWLPARGAGGLPATASRKARKAKERKPPPASTPTPAPIDSAADALAGRRGNASTEPGPTPGEGAEDAQSGQPADRSTSLAALRRRFMGRD